MKGVTEKRPGSVQMTPENSDDLWLAYNLISPGDTIIAVTGRKVLRESGKDAGRRVKLELEIKVKSLDYDKRGSILRISGNNTLENEHVKIGAFHTLQLNLNQPFVLNKEIWDSLALDSLLQDSDPGSISDTKAARALNEFFKLLSNDPARTCYGPRHVEVAHEYMAVRTLLITDDLFRNADVSTRKKYVNLVDSVKDSGGTVHIFSSMQLAQLTGIAAILRFPLPDLEHIEM